MNPRQSTGLRIVPPDTGRRNGSPNGRNRSLRLGTRRSLLAVTQSRWVGRQVTRLTGHSCDLVETVTPGDVCDGPVASLGTPGVFVTPLREALLRGETDLVVHSFKDLPTLTPPGLVLAAVPERADPRDALIHPGGHRLLDLPPGSRIGTSSARRALEVRRLGLPVEVIPLRGNVDTRLRKVAAGDVDALLLAAAGLARLDRLDLATELIDPALILPAPAQGALAVECRADDLPMRELLAALDDPPTRHAVAAERAFLAALDAGCSAPVGALARYLDDGALALDALAGPAEGFPEETAVRLWGRCTPAQGPRLARQLAAVARRIRDGGGARAVPATDAEKEAPCCGQA